MSQVSQADFASADPIGFVSKQMTSSQYPTINLHLSPDHSDSKRTFVPLSNVGYSNDSALTRRKLAEIQRFKRRKDT